MYSVISTFLFNLLCWLSLEVDLHVWDDLVFTHLSIISTSFTFIFTVIIFKFLYKSQELIQNS